MAVTCFPQVAAMLVELNPQLLCEELTTIGEPIGKREIFRKYPDVVDVPQLCEMLGGSRPVSKKTAYRMLNAGKIKAFRIGRSYRIPKVNVIRFLQKETPADCNTVNAAIDSVE